MSDPVSTATELAILQAGRNPQWAVQPTAMYNLPPQNVAAGVPLQNSLRTRLWLELRPNIAGRTVEITLTTLADANITVTLNSNSEVYDGSSDTTLEQQATNLAAAITANGTLNALVAASASGATVTLIGRAFADYPAAVAFSAGGAATVVGDASSATARVFTLPRGANAPGWNGRTSTISLTQYGYEELLVSAGIESGYVQISTIAGVSGDGNEVTVRPVTINWGPSVTESA